MGRTKLFYKYEESGESMVQTDAETESEFLSDVTDIIHDLIHKGWFMSFEAPLDLKTAKELSTIAEIIRKDEATTIEESFDIEIHLQKSLMELVRGIGIQNEWGYILWHWIRDIVSICVKMRGYPSQAIEHRIFTAGDFKRGFYPLASTGNSMDVPNSIHEKWKEDQGFETDG